jgi:hypothetical protein
MNTKSLVDYTIFLGSEGTTASDDKIQNITIIGNKEYGALYYDGTKASTEHGIFVGFNANPIIKYNYVNGSGINIIVKDSGRSYPTANISYNICINAGLYGFYSKGVQDVQFYGNTVYNTIDIAAYGFYITENGAGETSSGCIIKNNIIINKSVNVGNYLIVILGSTGIISDYNILYNSSGKYGKDSASLYNTFSLWLAHSQDAHSINQDVSFIGIYNPSPVIQAGEVLNVTYDDGLDASTVWGDENTLPIVVTKQQGVSWDIGAYVH